MMVTPVSWLAVLPKAWSESVPWTSGLPSHAHSRVARRPVRHLTPHYLDLHVEAQGVLLALFLQARLTLRQRRGVGPTGEPLAHGALVLLLQVLVPYVLGLQNVRVAVYEPESLHRNPPLFSTD